MSLKEYLEKNKAWLSRAYFARRIGISSTALWRIENGLFVPTLLTAYRIHVYTQGQVTYDDLIAKLLESGSEAISFGEVTLPGRHTRHPKPDTKNVRNKKRKKIPVRLDLSEWADD